MAPGLPGDDDRLITGWRKLTLNARVYYLVTVEGLPYDLELISVKPTIPFYLADRNMIGRRFGAARAQAACWYGAARHARQRIVHAQFREPPPGTARAVDPTRELYVVLSDGSAERINLSPGQHFDPNKLLDCSVTQCDTLVASEGDAADGPTACFACESYH
jgi:hypothetical protein